MPLQGSLSIERMCQLAGVSRAGFYRSLQERAPVQEGMEVRSVVQQIAVEHRRRYGCRRISAELRRRGMVVNHKRVLRMMREDNLLAVQPRAFVATTDSDHEFEVYLNLASRMKLTGLNQLWAADITYVRLQKEFVYLAIILDAFSRKVVGWALDRGLAARLPIAALEQAIAKRQPSPGLVHHSDRGVQYASGEYAAVLRKRQMIPSMSRPANPYDNASCESFMKTLKREVIYANDYRDLKHLLGNIDHSDPMPTPSKFAASITAAKPIAERPQQHGMCAGQDTVQRKNSAKQPAPVLSPTRFPTTTTFSNPTTPDAPPGPSRVPRGPPDEKPRTPLSASVHGSPPKSVSRHNNFQNLPSPWRLAESPV